MADTEGIRSFSGAQSHPESRRPLTTKLHLYQALYVLNRGFEATLIGLKRLEELGIFQEDDLDTCKAIIERTRAQTNEELASTLQEYEEDDAVYWDRRVYAQEKQNEDPDDVFLEAQKRRREIKEQIKDLQSGLDRQRPAKARQPTRKKRRKKA